MPINKQHMYLVLYKNYTHILNMFSIKAQYNLQKYNKVHKIAIKHSQNHNNL